MRRMLQLGGEELPPKEDPEEQGASSSPLLRPLSFETSGRSVATACSLNKEL